MAYLGILSSLSMVNYEPQIASIHSPFSTLTLDICPGGMSRIAIITLKLSTDGDGHEW